MNPIHAPTRHCIILLLLILAGLIAIAVVSSARADLTPAEAQAWRARIMRPPAIMIVHRGERVTLYVNGEPRECASQLEAELIAGQVREFFRAAREAGS